MKWKVAKKISDDVNIDNMRTQLLLNRGLKTEREIEDFFNPKLENYEGEFELVGIKQACKRILKAKEKSELVVIFGDYDVDGICATAILYKALSVVGVRVMPFVPLREKHGYGLSKEAIHEIKEKYPDVGFLITVDNGIVAFEAALEAAKVGLDLVITDHHVAEGRYPQALAVVHSTKFAGSGVAWCLARALVDEEHAKELLQFACLGTVADMMEVLGANRAIVTKGLEVINSIPNLGLRALVEVSGVNLGTVGTFEIGFMIAPRLNATGRLDSALPSLRLLCTNNPIKARLYAKELDEANALRQQVLLKALEEARLQVQGDNFINVVWSKGWIAGIVGLVAARVVEQTNIPTLAIALDSESARGSARSIEGVDIIKLLRKVKGVFDSLGGHSGAAGFSLPAKKILKLKDLLKTLAKKDNLQRVEKLLAVDMEIEIGKVNMDLAKMVEEFSPFGMGNPMPLFVSRDLELSDLRLIGGGKHLKFRAGGVEAVYFGAGGLFEEVGKAALVDLAYHLEINQFNGSKILQMRVKDMLGTDKDKSF